MIMNDATPVHRFLILRLFEGIDCRCISGETIFGGDFWACVSDLIKIADLHGAVARPPRALVEKLCANPDGTARAIIFREAQDFAGCPKGFSQRTATFLWMPAFTEFFRLAGVDEPSVQQLLALIVGEFIEERHAHDSAVKESAASPSVVDDLIARLTRAEKTVRALCETNLELARRLDGFEQRVLAVERSGPASIDVKQIVKEARREAAEELRRSIGPAYGTAMRMIEGK